MSIERSEEFILAALFLARCGPGSAPPHYLDAYTWAHAYASFYDALHDGRTLRAFRNSLKASRDQFDSHVDSDRVGWREEGAPKPLPDRDARILAEWSARSDDELWEAVRPLVDPEVAKAPARVLTDLENESDEDEKEVYLGIDGRERAVVSRVRERSPGLRAAALRIHGSSCQVCGFNFGAVYGDWGAGFAEVHHLQPLSEAPEEGRQVDPESDLAVLCSNCHRMVHLKRDRVVTLEELRVMISDAAK